MPTRARLARAVVACIVAASTFMVGPRVPAGAATPFSEVTVISQDGVNPTAITAGPDGNVWFADKYNHAIGRVAPDGTIALFHHPEIVGPNGIAAGSDGNLWFTVNWPGPPGIGRITPAGDVTVFRDPGITDPDSITSGPDGNLWFVNENDLGHSSTIGRITPAGVVTTFHDDSFIILASITTGPDGNLWFTDPLAARIGRISPTGTITTFSDPALTTPLSITAGPDGNLWFTDVADRVGMISPAGVVTTYTDDAIDAPQGIAAGPDGNLWFASAVRGSVSRITPTGEVTELPALVHRVTSGTFIAPVAAGPDGNLWFGWYGTISRVTPAGALTDFHGSLAGPQNLTVATDGTVWFTNRAGHSIGHVTAEGTTVTYTSDILDQPYEITPGPDDSLWFTDSGANRIGRITPSGEITTVAAPGISRPRGIVLGPDGALWFTNAGNNSIGRLQPPEAVTTFPFSWGVPEDITTAKDGALWFTHTNGIGRITTAGEAASYSNPTINHPNKITRGPDGHLWFTNGGNTPSIGRVSMGGFFMNYPFDYQWAAPEAITAGADGNVWFSTWGGIGRINSLGQMDNRADTGTSQANDLALAPDGNLWYTSSYRQEIGYLGMPAFTDVPPSHPFRVDISWLSNSGIARGNADGTFGALDPTTRQSMAAFLYRYAGSPRGSQPTCATSPKVDVPVGAPFCGEIAWLVDQKITTGYPDGTFHPSTPVSREAMAAFLYRFARSPGGPHPVCSSAPSKDVEVGHPFCGEIAWMIGAGISVGYPDGTFRPGERVTRQAMAAFLHKLTTVVPMTPRSSQ